MYSFSLFSLFGELNWLGDSFQDEWSWLVSLCTIISIMGSECWGVNWRGSILGRKDLVRFLLSLSFSLYTTIGVLRMYHIFLHRGGHQSEQEGQLLTGIYPSISRVK
jgi:hypothetical protein